jgi:uncharacterized LabA/DUF88 family protein
MNILQFPTPTPSAPPPFWMPFSSICKRPRRTRAAAPAGPFAALAGKRVLLLVDDDNIRVSCQNALGSTFSYRALAAELDRITRSCEKHAFFSSSPGDQSRQAYFKRRGYKTLDLKREYESTPNGRVTTNSNADFDLVVHGAYLLALRRYECVVAASGDGDLVLALARGVRRMQPSVKVFTLSVPGCSSHRILTRSTPLVSANFLIADSMLRPLSSRRTPPAKQPSLEGVRHAS